MESIGERIRQARVSASLTQQQLAQRLETTKATISRWENGNVDNIAINKIEQLAGICGVTPAWIMTWSSSRSPIPVPMNKMIYIWDGVSKEPYPQLQESGLGFEFVDEASGIDFCLRVKGDAMIGARIFEGDLAFVRKQQTVENGDIAVLLSEERETLIRRIYILDSSYILHAENPTIPDSILTPKEFKNFKVLGIVQYIKFKAL